MSRSELMNLYKKSEKQFEVMFQTPKGIVVDFIKASV